MRRLRLAVGQELPYRERGMVQPADHRFQHPPTSSGEPFDPFAAYQRRVLWSTPERHTP